MLSAVPGNLEVAFFQPNFFVSPSFVLAWPPRAVDGLTMHGSWCLLEGYGIALLHTTTVVSPSRKSELCPGMAGSYVFYGLNCALEFHGKISSLLYIQYTRHNIVVMVKFCGCGCKPDRVCRCFRNGRKASLLKPSMFFSIYIRMPI